MYIHKLVPVSNDSWEVNIDRTAELLFSRLIINTMFGVSHVTLRYNVILITVTVRTYTYMWHGFPTINIHKYRLSLICCAKLSIGNTLFSAFSLGIHKYSSTLCSGQAGGPMTVSLKTVLTLLLGALFCLQAWLTVTKYLEGKTNLQVSGVVERDERFSLLSKDS